MEIIKWVNFDGAGFGGIENYSSSSRRANEDITKNPITTTTALLILFLLADNSPGNNSQNVTKNIVPAPNPCKMHS